MVVARETAEHIIQVAKVIGYQRRQPSFQARKKTKNLRLIAVVDSMLAKVRDGRVPSADYESFYRSYLNTLLHELALRNSQMALFNPSIGDLRQALLASGASGVVWRGYFPEDLPLFRWAADHFPLVSVDHHPDNQVDLVTMDNEALIRTAAGHLFDRGHRRIGLFLENSPRYDPYWRAFERFAANAQINYQGFPSLTARFPPEAIDPERFVDTWAGLGADVRPTGIIMMDHYALRVMSAAKARGIALPEQLSIVGIDNVPAGAVAEPPLTSIAQPIEEICRAAISVLEQRMTYPHAGRELVLISPRLIPRGSVAPPPE
jgi:DNA-binding LacI/PurR family transcriptional regulator